MNGKTALILAAVLAVGLSAGCLTLYLPSTRSESNGFRI